jgi:hypothetical protein
MAENTFLEANNDAADIPENQRGRLSSNGRSPKIGWVPVGSEINKTATFVLFQEVAAVSARQQLIKEARRIDRLIARCGPQKAHFPDTRGSEHVRIEVGGEQLSHPQIPSRDILLD